MIEGVWMNWLASIFSPIADLIKEPLVEWQKRKTLEVAQVDKQLDRQHELNLKKVDVATELAKQGMQIEANWDTNAQQDMKTSWKDEYLTILFSIPLILAFFPQTQEAVLKGFETLNKTPDWYMMLVTGIVAGVFGLRWLVSRGKK
jgi:hypothetical protein